MTSAARQFSETAEGYAATMAPSLRPIAAEVVRRAALEPGDRVIDLGTGTGIAAAAARGEGRVIVGVDAAPGMLAIARAEVEGVRFEEGDFSTLPFPDGSFDVAIAAHALLFAEDRVETLREWLRVVRDGGRLSLSVPGPNEVTPDATYAEIWRRFGVKRGGGYPVPEEIAVDATKAGWVDVETVADPTAAIRLADEDAFRLWRSIGSRSKSTARFSDEEQDRLTNAMLEVTPRAPDGSLCIPFGAIYLTSRRPTT